MTKSLKVGITGGIGAGKSIISKIFSVLGVAVYDADSRARMLMNSNPQLIESIKGLFGEKAFRDNQLDREVIGKAAFSQPELLKKLNALVHPAVHEDYLDWVHQQKESPYTLKEAALLFESGSYRQLDAVIYVSAPEDLRIARVLQRDPHRTKEDIRQIMDRQWADEKKVKLADSIIENDRDSRLIPQVLELHELFLTKVTR